MTQTCESRNALPVEIQQCALLQLLANSLVLSQTAPYLSCYDVLNLAATARAFRFLVYHTPNVFRRLDLGRVKTAQFEIDAIDHGGQTWRNVQVDEYLSEEDFYAGPLRGIFSKLRRADILRDVQVLSLDGLSVTAELVHDILTDPSFSVRILSIRGVKNMNERKLRAALQYACRQSRPEGAPRLKGLYVFGPRDASPPASASPPTAAAAAVATTWNARSQKALTASLAEEPEAWYVRRGNQFPNLPNRISPEWASTLVACAGVISFDAVLCTGPRHFNSPAWGKVYLEAPDASVPHFSVATHSLGGCASCGSAPEGWTVWGEELLAASGGRDADADADAGADADGCRRRTSESYVADLARFPLLAPPPMHSASLRVAMCPTGQSVKPRRPFSPSGKQQGAARFIPRCFDCIRDRYCAGCHKWWCEACYVGPRASSLSGPGPRGCLCKATV
ncbi:hypothetical protein MYCTH_2139749 [Thermothelomyces thermophilus ATCC 42464]|uniref:F-box domain-containing protein n=1 Tax=Thermothelomyces thermophilus (strain ATCC 42464 / BCRC 31852 / DSM 1799) TaxID=573729 RepID=G2QFE5_THET4|nr:uncharacterized protein MYCTH_2139749 [Thermothelomyces thermophilus ATCC 42464]AEO59174.1 hypothetical protein MYCTH_2139749 [Thermothelomyces thermophilus ATCC 42464]